MNSELVNKLQIALEAVREAEPYIERADANVALFQEKVQKYNRAFPNKTIKNIFVVLSIFVSCTVVFAPVGLPCLWYYLSRKRGVIKGKEYLDAAKQELITSTEITNRNLDKVDFLPQEYRTSFAIDYLIGVIKSERADSLKEALAMFDEYFHRYKMENMSREMVSYNAVQTELLKNIEINTFFS